MAVGIRQVAALPDPVGELERMTRRPNGMQVGRLRVPIGVVGFIYESRPNVTADAAALCVKAGNAVVLRGGREALESNTVIAAILAKGIEKAGLPPEAIGFIDVVDRQAVEVLLELDRFVDLVVPRGGERFVRLVRQMSNETQFIMITHSRRTMEAADVLYGVTMEEAGCSKLVSVSFAELEAS